MLGRILTAGLIGGVLGGAAVAAIQAVTTTPLILHAESFEVASHGEAIIHLVHGHAEAAAHERHLDFARFALTAIATIAVATGYAWMLLAAMFMKGDAINARSVVPWAVAAFFAIGLAPAFGLAPELPGAAAAELPARQLWWLFTVVASAGGLAAIFLLGSPLWTAIGIVAIALPHLIGAPQPSAESSTVPAELAARFVAASLALQLLMWAAPGAIAGFCMSRFEEAATAKRA